MEPKRVTRYRHMHREDSKPPPLLLGARLADEGARRAAKFGEPTIAPKREEAIDNADD
jgi:hypothetical protein